MSALHPLPGLLPLRMVADHEGFADQLPVSRWTATRRSASAAFMAMGFSHSTCLPARAARSVHSACSCSQRVVDGLDIRIGEQRFVAATGTRDAKPCRRGACLAGIAGRERGDHRQRPAHHRRHAGCQSEVACTEHTPAHRIQCHRNPQKVAILIPRSCASPDRLAARTELSDSIRLSRRAGSSFDRSCLHGRKARAGLLLLHYCARSPGSYLCSASACGGPAHSDRIFVSQAGSSTIAVIDASSGTTSRIDVGMLPHGFALSADASRLYVALVGSQAVAESDTRSRARATHDAHRTVPDRREDGSLIQAHFDQRAFFPYHLLRLPPAGPHPAQDRRRQAIRPAAVTGWRAPVRLAPAVQRHFRARPRHRPHRTQRAAGTAGAATEAVALARVDDEIWGGRCDHVNRRRCPAHCGRLDAATLESRGDVPTGSDPGAMVALADRGSVLVSNFETNTVTEHSRPA